MSQQQINLNTDLKRLRDEGYNVKIVDGHLILDEIPYLNQDGIVKRGAMISHLDLAGDITVKPVKNHVVYFSGDYPCKTDKSLIEEIRHQPTSQTLGGVQVKHSFSSKPKSGYNDYYEKMTTYASIISHPAVAVDPGATPKTFPMIEADQAESVFNYIDTSSSRCGIDGVVNKFKDSRVAIIGVGGTGSYVLDLVAKTPVKEIHLYDADLFLQHNAFRSPGAPSNNQLTEKPFKVEYLAAIYLNMRKNIIPHNYKIEETTVDELSGVDFVFLCLDGGGDKEGIISKLHTLNIPFIDTGMGIQLRNDSLMGILRVTTSTPNKRDHISSRISRSGVPADDLYSRNIQIADMNALNAALAVIKWKKLIGFYSDLENEHNTTYTIDGNVLNNDEME